jgi:hypothetical protein
VDVTTFVTVVETMTGGTSPQEPAGVEDDVGVLAGNVDGVPGVDSVPEGVNGVPGIEGVGVPGGAGAPGDVAGVEPSGGVDGVDGIVAVRGVVPGGSDEVTGVVGGLAGSVPVPDIVTAVVVVQSVVSITVLVMVTVTMTVSPYEIAEIPAEMEAARAALIPAAVTGSDNGWPARATICYTDC